MKNEHSWINSIHDDVDSDVERDINNDVGDDVGIMLAMMLGMSFMTSPPFLITSYINNKPWACLGIISGLFFLNPSI
jgi:hypothetical protein